ncbi:MAG TPA: Spy/CpxP family protein refolding chaperone [Dokdonella sp.]
MNTASSFSTIAARLRPWLPRALAVGLAVGVALGAGVTAWASGADMAAWHHGAPMTSQDLAHHVDDALPRVYAELGVTDAQKSQLDPMVKQIIDDVGAIHAQMGNLHAQALDLLTQDTVDRDAIEALRVAHVAGMDQASQRMTQLIGDLADVLTPAQRKALAAHIAQLHAAAPAQG